MLYLMLGSSGVRSQNIPHSKFQHDLIMKPTPQIIKNPRLSSVQFFVCLFVFWTFSRTTPMCFETETREHLALSVDKPCYYLHLSFSAPFTRQRFRLFGCKCATRLLRSAISPIFLRDRFLIYSRLQSAKSYFDSPFECCRVLLALFKVLVLGNSVLEAATF